MSTPKTLSIDGVDYVRADHVKAKKIDTNGKVYVIVRGDRSGVFAGFLDTENGQEVVLTECRRLWYWKGAASISQIAERGVSDPMGCKFPEPVSRIKIKDAIEILQTTELAYNNIIEVPLWIE
jgi:hypothetical protein